MNQRSINHLASRQVQKVVWSVLRSRSIFNASLSKKNWHKPLEKGGVTKSKKPWYRMITGGSHISISWSWSVEQQEKHQKIDKSFKDVWDERTQWRPFKWAALDAILMLVNDERESQTSCLVISWDGSEQGYSNLPEWILAVSNMQSFVDTTTDSIAPLIVLSRKESLLWYHLKIGSTKLKRNFGFNWVIVHCDLILLSWLLTCLQDDCNQWMAGLVSWDLSDSPSEASVWSLPNYSIQIVKGGDLHQFFWAHVDEGNEDFADGDGLVEGDTGGGLGWSQTNGEAKAAEN